MYKGFSGKYNGALGFTLIELMISLTLGLIISAAAILLFLTGQKSYSLQKALSCNGKMHEPAFFAFIACEFHIFVADLPEIRP